MDWYAGICRIMLLVKQRGYVFTRTPIALDIVVVVGDVGSARRMRRGSKRADSLPAPEK